MNEKHIVVVEDEVKIGQILQDYLQRDGFQVTLLHDGSEAVETIQALKPDFVILDLMLPVKDGITICKEVRQFSEVPIIMLTARVDEIDRLLGLKMGADDYVCKPFLPRELVARVHTILRRINRSSSSNNEPVEKKLTYKKITLDLARHQCTVNEQLIDLTPVEFAMLKVLLEKPSHVFSRNHLMDQCYSDSRVVSDRTIDSHIKNLRKKIALYLDDDELIHSIYGVGYKIE